MILQRAFTLIELLVVIVISAILASVILLSMRDSSKDYFLRDDLSRLAALMERNCRDALVSGHHIGIRLDDTGYDVFRHEGADWVSIKGDSIIYRHHDWSGDWRMNLEFQGREAYISDGEDTPQLICLGSGELLPFRLAMSGGVNLSLVLSGQPNGQVAVETSR